MNADQKSRPELCYEFRSSCLDLVSVGELSIDPRHQMRDQHSLTRLDPISSRSGISPISLLSTVFTYRHLILLCRCRSAVASTSPLIGAIVTAYCCCCCCCCYKDNRVNDMEAAVHLHPGRQEGLILNLNLPRHGRRSRGPEQGIEPCHPRTSVRAKGTHARCRAGFRATKKASR